MKRWFLPAAARARGQSNDLNREILASNLFNCCKEVKNAHPVPSILRWIHIVYRHKNVWEYQWSNFIYNCMSTFLHYVHCKDALLDCSAPGGEKCESLTRVDEISLCWNYMMKTYSTWIWVRSRRCACLVTWFCCHLIAKPVKRSAHLHDLAHITNPIIFQFFRNLATIDVAILIKSSCFTSQFVPNLEAKSVVPELSTRDSEHCWWSLLCVVNWLNKMGRAMSRPDRTAVISIYLLQWYTCWIFMCSQKIMWSAGFRNVNTKVSSAGSLNPNIDSTFC